MRAEWLTEDQAPGVRLSLRVERRLLRQSTPYQEIELVQTETLGRVLMLDGRIMVSERDEAFYHEMLVHPAMLMHAHPRRVLIVGGGDGGAAREVLAHPTVEAVTLVEIDREVIAVSRDHLSSVHEGVLDDPRVQIEIAPAESFVPACSGLFDVTIVDSTDPIGSGRALFERGFLSACRGALKRGGLIALQAGSPFYYPGVLSCLVAALRKGSACVRPYLGFVPCYPSGLWAYVLAGEDLELDEQAVRERFASRGLVTCYYTPELHRAAFALPRFVEDLIVPEEER